MRYEFYLDTYFFTNFLMDITALQLAGLLLKQKRSAVRLVVAGVAGSMAGLILFLVLRSYLMYGLLIHLLINPMMLLLAYRWNGIALYIREWIAVYLAIILLGGSMEWLYAQVFCYHAFPVCYLLTLFVATLGVTFLHYRRQSLEQLYEVTIHVKDHEFSVQGYYDTGNKLIDPYLNLPASLIARSVLTDLSDGEKLPSRLIPYQALGTDSGLVEAVTVDELRIHTTGESHTIAPAVLALGETALFAGKTYQLILHSSLLIQ